MTDPFGFLGCYYLVDASYTSGEGFFAPYRETRYHILEQRDDYASINHAEYFNIKHAFERNVIENCFEVIKMSQAILRSASFYPIKTQIRIISACCLIHNLITREMSLDPMKNEYDMEQSTQNVTDDEYVESIASSDQWSTWRDNLAKQMFDE